MVSENSRNNEEIVRRAADVIELNQRFFVVTYKQKNEQRRIISSKSILAVVAIQSLPKIKRQLYLVQA